MPITPPAGSRAETPHTVLLNLSRAEIVKILHYVHPIPVGKGFTRDFLAKNYPGWELQFLMGWFKEAKIITGDVFSRFKVKARVAGLLIYTDRTLEVVKMTKQEWEAHLEAQAQLGPFEREPGMSALIPAESLDLSSEAAIEKTARSIADQLLGDAPPPPSRHRRRPT